MKLFLLVTLVLALLATTPARAQQSCDVTGPNAKPVTDALAAEGVPIDAPDLTIPTNGKVIPVTVQAEMVIWFGPKELTALIQLDGCIVLAQSTKWPTDIHTYDGDFIVTGNVVGWTKAYTGGIENLPLITDVTIKPIPVPTPVATVKF